ncbi:MAG: acetate--CoA ligase family protein [Proteobacteria bacterium]|nr:acetate--CoA ligase family protein [Burkholderiales bacterium]
MARNLERLFNPRAVAIVGASQNVKTISGQPVWALAKHGYAGTLYPVNPKYQEVEGHRCYPSIAELPEVPDLALILVAAARVPQMLRDVGRKGIPFCIIFSSGFAETGAAGRALQDEIAAIAAEYSVAVVGPNCQGMIGVTDDVYAGFGSAFSGDNFRRGSLSMTTQSGGFGYGVVILAEEAGLGFRSVVSTGNEAGLTTTDFIEWFTQDPQTKVIGAYMEGVKDAHRLLEVGDHALDADKPVLIWKVGNTEVGQRAAASHTANLGGALALYEAAFKQRGMIRVRDANELIDYTQVFDSGKRPAGNRVAIVTISGGGGILMADQCVESGLSVGSLSPTSEAKLKDIIPSFGSWQNPIDITAGIFNNPEMLAQAMQIIVDDPTVDSIVVINASLQGEIATLRAQELVELSAKTSKPILTAWSAREKFAADAYRVLREGHVPRFATPVSCAKALAALTTFAEAQRRRVREKAESVLTLERPEAKAMLAGRTADLAEFQAKALIAQYGIPVTAEMLVHDRAEAAAAARSLGYPVVLKVQSADIAHKTEAGGVRIGLTDERAVEQAYDEVIASAKAYAPDAVIDGVSVQEMVAGGTELIVGVQNDPLFGPAVMVGLGGIHAEVFKDVSFRLAPLTRSVAESMLRELKSFPLLDGVRGRPLADVEAVVDTLLALSALAIDLKDHLAELDVNPLLVRERGRGVKALDALAKPRLAT